MKSCAPISSEDQYKEATKTAPYEQALNWYILRVHSLLSFNLFLGIQLLKFFKYSEAPPDM